MRFKGFVVIVVGALFGSAFATPSVAACQADSGDVRATLVELYTSEGCSSCPPADRALTRLDQRGPKVIPLAFHVDYWDAIGWKDPFAQSAFTRRQAWEVQANRNRTSFTPHFFVNGREVQDWRADLEPALGRDSGKPTVRLRVRAEPQGSTKLRLVVDGEVAAGTRSAGPLQLYVALTEDRLVSQVDAGENRGVRLEHDAVVRQWIGPIAVQGGSTGLDRVVDVPQLARGQVGVVAFIQDSTSAEVLQAVDTGICKAG